MQGRRPSHGSWQGRIVKGMFIVGLPALFLQVALLVSSNDRTTLSIDQKSRQGRLLATSSIQQFNNLPIDLLTRFVRCKLNSGKQCSNVPITYKELVTLILREYNATTSQRRARPVLYRWETLVGDDVQGTTSLREAFSVLKEDILLGRIRLKPQDLANFSEHVTTNENSNHRVPRPVELSDNALQEHSKRRYGRLADLNIQREVKDQTENSLNLCPLKYHTTACSVLFISDSTVKSRVSRGSVAQTKDQTRRGLISINGDVIFDWETRVGDVFLVRIDDKCNVMEKLKFRCKITRAKDLVDSPFTKYLASLPNGTVLAGVAYGNSRHLFRDQLPVDPAGVAILRPHSGIKTSFVHVRGYPGLGTKIVDAGTDYQVNQTTYTFGHHFKLTIQNQTYNDVRKEHPDVELGGHWKPSTCRSRSRIAVIIPFRNRHQHLAIFLDNIISFLKLQQIEHRIFVVEQIGPELFNRAALMNVGYKEAKKYNSDCYVFHDVDQLPEDLSNWYHCSDEPRHLTATRSCTDYRLRFPLYFGGAVSLTPSLIEEMNGFPNKWFGWGGEDDDMLGRLLYFNHTLQRFPLEIGRYTSLQHQKEETGNPHLRIKSSQQIREESGQSISTDGLTTLNISYVQSVQEVLYTHISVRIPGPRTAEEEERRRWPDVQASRGQAPHLGTLTKTLSISFILSFQLVVQI